MIDFPTADESFQAARACVVNRQEVELTDALVKIRILLASACSAGEYTIQFDNDALSSASFRNQLVDHLTAKGYLCMRSRKLAVSTQGGVHKKMLLST